MPVQLPPVPLKPQLTTPPSLDAWKSVRRSLRALRSGPERVFSGLVLGLAGADDLLTRMREMANAAGLTIHVIRVDLRLSTDSNFADPSLFALFRSWCEEGLIDWLIVRPPTSSWGKPWANFRETAFPFEVDASAGEHRERMINDSRFLVHALALAAILLEKDGTWVIELPGARTTAIMETRAVQELLEKPGVRVTEFSPCGWSAPVCEMRVLLHNFRQYLPVRPCVHEMPLQHGARSIQRAGPNTLATTLLGHVLQNLNDDQERGSGPGGWRRSGIRTRRVYTPLRPERVLIEEQVETGEATHRFLNETAAEGGLIFLKEGQTATYLHVDDGLIFSQRVPATSPVCNDIMNIVADDLSKLGFVIKERIGAENRDKKMIGVRLDPQLPVVSLPANKAMLLRESLWWVASHPTVNTGILRSLVGVWTWAALLARPLLSAMHVIFTFIERFPDQTVLWWPSARWETRRLGHLVPALRADLSRMPFAWICASDASGSNSIDEGGLGLTTAWAPPQLAQSVAATAPRPGRTIANLNGTFRGMRNHRKELDSRIAASLLPPETFALAWLPIASRRLVRREHITLKEARGSLWLLELATATGRCRRRILICLMDNEAWSSATFKGRSPKYALNRLLQKRAALTTACEIDFLLPWIDTHRQPSDALSRTWTPY